MSQLSVITFGIRSHVIVTGPTSGIGEQLAVGFGESGSDVTCVEMNLEEARKKAHEIDELGRRAIAIDTDVADPDRVAVMVNRVTEKFGRIDVLQHYAGINIQGDAEAFDLAAWEKVIKVNLAEIFFCDKAVGKQMIEKIAGGSIINVSSFCSTHIVKRDHQCAYYASKGADADQGVGGGMDSLQHQGERNRPRFHRNRHVSSRPELKS